MNMLRTALILGFCGFAVTSHAAKSMLQEKVVSIGADHAVELEHTGMVTFANVVFPDDALIERWMGSHLLQKEINFESYAKDRYGRVSIVSDMEEAMLRDGVAVIYATKAPPSSWHAAEASARQAKRGVWAEPNFIITPADAGKHLQQFRFVEGTITYIYDAKRATFLNFGNDWHQDFSVAIPGRARRGMKTELDALHKGSRIRVRGTLYEENGPMIRIDRPEQLESL